MTLFRSELIPFHPPRYASRIGAGLSRYGRARGSRENAHGPSPHEATARACSASANAAHATTATTTTTAEAVVPLAA